MASLWTENFEDTGYERGARWSESGNQDASSVVDEDDAGPGSLPTNGGSQCLELYRAQSEADEPFALYTHTSVTATTYTRFYVYLPSTTTFPNSSTIRVFESYTDWSNDLVRVYFNKDESAVITLRAIFHTSTGAWSSAQTSGTVSTNTWYCVEFQYDQGAGNAWEFRVNGSTVGTPGLPRSTGDISSIDRWRFEFHPDDTATGYGTVYIDQIKVDNATWVGQETAEGGGGFPILDGGVAAMPILGGSVVR